MKIHLIKIKDHECVAAFCLYIHKIGNARQCAEAKILNHVILWMSDKNNQEAVSMLLMMMVVVGNKQTTSD